MTFCSDRTGLNLYLSKYDFIKISSDEEDAWKKKHIIIFIRLNFEPIFCAISRKQNLQNINLNLKIQFATEKSKPKFHS